MLIEEISKYRSLLESVLTEAQSYDDMFNDVKRVVASTNNPELITKTDSEIKDAISKAKTVFKKSDRVIWWLRLWKVGLLGRLITKVPDIEALYNRFSDDLAKRSNTDTHIIHNDALLINSASRMYLEKFAHYLSLPIPDIQNYVFGFNSLDTILVKFDDYEEVWKAKATELIPYDPKDGKVILKFPDGYFWQNLNRAYCRAEGSAMGHCGNTASYKAGDEVLSLRQIVKRGDKMYVRPSLTFILDRNGFLGEMKGRANNKPEERYHRYIVELLKLPLIQGIKGGGYAPEQNFSINDLDETTKEDLIELKPTLGTLQDIYNRYGVNTLFKEMLDSKVNGTKLDYLDIIDKKVVVETWNNFESFINDIDDKVVQYFNNIYFDDDYDDVLDISEKTISNEDIYDLIDGMSTESYADLMRRLGIQPVSPNKAIRYRRSIQDAVELFRKDPDLMEDLLQAIRDVLEKRKETAQTIKDKALSVIQRYIEVGWPFNVVHAYLIIDGSDLEKTIELVVNLDDYVSIVSAESDDDDEYAYDQYQVYDNGWSGIENYNLESMRKDENLPNNYVKTDTSNLKKLMDTVQLEDFNFKMFSKTFANIANLM